MQICFQPVLPRILQGTAGAEGKNHLGGDKVQLCGKPTVVKGIKGEKRDFKFGHLTVKSAGNELRVFKEEKNKL